MRMVPKRRFSVCTAVAVALAGAAIVAASEPSLAAPERPKRQPETQPLCRDVGGYSAYLRRTGKICRLSGEEFNNPGYRGFR